MKKKISALLLAALLLLSLSITAFADLDSERSCSITIKLKARDELQPPMEGAVLSLFKAGEPVIQDSCLSYVPSKEFAPGNFSLKNLNLPGLAEQLSAYAQLKGLRGITQKTDKNGAAAFSPLSPGLYLVVQEGKLNGTMPLSPFLVSVPMTDPEGEDWIYDVEASPKIAPDPGKPQGSRTELTVFKYWADDSVHPESIKVHLLRSGKLYDSVVLSESNRWTHTWKELSPNFVWTVAEEIPEGYIPSYSSKGNSVTIVNSKKPELPKNPDELSVKKLWNKNEHPGSVSVELWNGSILYDRVKLSSENGWTHTWKDLPKSDKWEIIENPVPDAYYPSYSLSGNTITIKNSSIPEIPDKPDKPGGGGGGGGGKPPLIQTGQLNWPVPLLSGLGIVLFTLGWVLRRGKGRNDHEA